MFRYVAPNPYPVKKSWFSFSTSSLSSISGSGESLGELILPAQRYDDQEETKLESKDVDVSRGEVQTHDGAKLRTVIVSAKSEAKTSDREQKYVIKFNGNGGLYQSQMNVYADEAKKLGVSVVGFNYRNVAGSTGEVKEFQNLVTDGIAEVQRLLDQGVPSENILLHGHSLGGAIATKTAYHFHQLKKPIYLLNDRSFATIPKAAAGMVSSASIESIGAFSFSGIMSTAGWDGDAASAYKAIPAKYKNYFVVVPEAERSAGDGVISHKASLHTEVSPQEVASKNVTGTLFYSGRTPGHCLPHSLLFSKNNPRITAQNVYDDFVKKSLQKKM